MREIVVRNLTSDNRLERDCLITERMEQGDYSTRIARRCTYRIESSTTLPALQDSVSWAKTLDPQPARQVFVTKRMDPDTGDECVVYKVLGHLYVVMDRVVFCVGFRHTLSMDIGSQPDPTL